MPNIILALLECSAQSVNIQEDTDLMYRARHIFERPKISWKDMIKKEVRLL